MIKGRVWVLPTRVVRVVEKLLSDPAGTLLERLTKYKL